MMGPEEQNVPICCTTTLNEIALPIVPTGATPSARADSKALAFLRLAFAGDYFFASCKATMSQKSSPAAGNLKFVQTC